ncbi:lactonase family protein [Postechiella marina]|uniref:Lactonase family protein n=1 Tax=Postechiella marina TaxID=943941 RepID=A0ABP8CDD0_9FLAO
MILNFFIGSYTKMISPVFGGSGKGIYSVALNTETGHLQVLHKTKVVNPAYLAISSNNKFLYTITEVLAKDKPKVMAFRIKDDFSLEYINEQLISGDLPCHITYANSSVIVSCYGSGNVLQFNVNFNGELLPFIINHKHLGKSINTKRQESAHAHQSVVLSNNKDVFVPDLGIDKLKAYVFINGKLQLNNKKDINIEQGNGPRHVVFSKNGMLGYLLNELTGNISVLKLGKDGFKSIDTYKTLPHSFAKTPSASAIRLHPNNKFLYAANRTQEAISLFKIKGEGLEFVSYTYTKGKTLREFNIAPNGKLLIACLQDSNDVIVYKILEDGNLKELFSTQEVLSPVCITFFK